MADNRNRVLKPHEKIAMSISEAAKYSNLGENLLRKIIDADKSIDWVLFVGDWIKIKRKPFERWLLAQNSV